MNEITEILPGRFRKAAQSVCLNRVTDIRVCVGYPLVFMREEDELYLGESGICPKDAAFTVTREDAENIVGNATESSLYSFMEDIREGFITIRGGHRMGIAGMAVYEKGRLSSIKDINYINIRIAREIKGAANDIKDKILAGDRPLNTLIISAPGGGKTTLLRDIARILGNTENMRVAVIDSRFEIGARYKGAAQLDIGERSFLLSGYAKKDGFSHAVRSLSSRVVLCDEISPEDAPELRFALNSGVSVIATAHGSGISDIKNKFDASLFSRFVVLRDCGRYKRVFNGKGELL